MPFMWVATNNCAPAWKRWPETLPLKTVLAGRSGTSSPNSTKEPESAVKSRIISRRSRTGWNIAKQVLETVAIELGKPVTGLTGYGRWRAEIDRMAETGQRMMDDRDTYSPHLNGIPLGLEHVRWALTDIGRLIGKDGKQISEAAGHHRQGEEPATPETHEERQRRLLSEVQEFTRLLSATYDARSEEEARAANKALDEYVEREAKNHETPEEQESQTHKRSRGQRHKHVTASLLAKSTAISSNLMEQEQILNHRGKERSCCYSTPIGVLTCQSLVPNNTYPDTRRSRRRRATRIWRKIRCASPRCGYPCVDRRGVQRRSAREPIDVV